MRGSNVNGFGLVAGILVFTLALNLPAQEAGRDQSFALRADVKMILVPVTVMDRRGATVNGLELSSFTVLDDKVPQEIVSFSNEDVPCSVGLVLDLSGSMRNSLGPAKEALRKFLGTANPQDEFMLFGITTKPLIYPVGSFEDVPSFTSDTSIIQNSIQLAPLGGRTALVDTVYMALGKMRSARNSRRALVIVSDGMENHSRHSKGDLIRLAVESDVQIYTVAIDTVPHEKKAIHQSEARRALHYLEDLAEKTGGVPFVTRSRHDIADAAERLGSAIRNQYVLGFQPHNADASGKWRRVQVKLDRDQVRVYARNGYYVR